MWSTSCRRRLRGSWPRRPRNRSRSRVRPRAPTAGRPLAIGLPVLALDLTRSLLRALIVVHRLVWTEQREVVPKPTWTATVRLLIVLVALFVVVPVDRQALAVPGRRRWSCLSSTQSSSPAVAARHPPSPVPGRGWRDLAPGAVLFGVGADRSSARSRTTCSGRTHPRESTYGALGLAAALLLGLFITARLVVAAAVLNATLWATADRAEMTRSAPGCRPGCSSSHSRSD